VGLREVYGFKTVRRFFPERPLSSCSNGLEHFCALSSPAPSFFGTVAQFQGFRAGPRTARLESGHFPASAAASVAEVERGFLLLLKFAEARCFWRSQFSAFFPRRLRNFSLFLPATFRGGPTPWLSRALRPRRPVIERISPVVQNPSQPRASRNSLLQVYRPGGTPKEITGRRIAGALKPDRLVPQIPGIARSYSFPLLKPNHKLPPRGRSMLQGFLGANANRGRLSVANRPPPCCQCAPLVAFAAGQRWL